MRHSVIGNLSTAYLEFIVNWGSDVAGLIMVGKILGKWHWYLSQEFSLSYLCLPGPGFTYQGKNFHSRLECKAQDLLKLSTIISCTPRDTDKHWNQALGRIWKECRSSHLVIWNGTELSFIYKDSTGWHQRKALVNRHISIG